MDDSKLNQRLKNAANEFFGPPLVDLRGLYAEHHGDATEIAKHVARIIDESPEEAAIAITSVLMERADLQTEITKLHRLSRTDSLTTLFNKYHMMTELRRHCSTHAGEEHRHHPTGNNHLLMIDLDKFKPINDTYGHAAGDEALKAVALMLLHHTRKTDVVARMGGDEFLVLLKDITDEDAKKKSQEIMTAFQTLSFGWAQLSIDLRGSVGHSKIVPTLTAEQNLELADQRMYAEKQAKNVARGSQLKLS